MAEMDKTEVNIEEFLQRYSDFYNKDIYLSVKKSFKLELLNEFCAKRTDIKYLWAWGVLIQQLPIEYFSSQVLDFLVSNNIQLIALCHLPLSDDWLMKIFNADNTCDEALYTLGIRFIQSDIGKFRKFIEAYVNEALYEYLLKWIISENTINSEMIGCTQLLIRVIFDNFGKSTTICKFAERMEKYIIVINTTSQDEMNRASNSQDFLQLLALSLNPNCPNSILQKLSKVDNIKYAKRIRTNVMRHLH